MGGGNRVELIAEKEKKRKTASCVATAAFLCVDWGSGEIKLVCSSLLPPLDPVCFFWHSIFTLTLFLRNKIILLESKEKVQKKRPLPSIILKKKVMRWKSESHSSITCSFLSFSPTEERDPLSHPTLWGIPAYFCYGLFLPSFSAAAKRWSCVWLCMFLI